VPSWPGRRIDKERDSNRKVVVCTCEDDEMLEGRKMKAMAERIEKRVANWIDIFGWMKILRDENMSLSSVISKLFELGGTVSESIKSSQNNAEILKSGFFESPESPNRCPKLSPCAMIPLSFLRII
jgi:hypothetical protein